MNKHPPKPPKNPFKASLPKVKSTAGKYRAGARIVKS